MDRQALKRDKIDYEFVGGRRFILTVISLVVHTTLLLFDHVGEQTYADLMLWTLGAYIAGNTGQRIFTGGRTSESPRDQRPRQQESDDASSNRYR